MLGRGLLRAMTGGRRRRRPRATSKRECAGQPAGTVSGVAFGYWLTSMMGPSKGALRWLWSLTTLAMSTVKEPFVTVAPAIASEPRACWCDRRPSHSGRAAPPGPGTPRGNRFRRSTGRRASTCQLSPSRSPRSSSPPCRGELELGRGRPFNEVDVHVRADDGHDGHQRRCANQHPEEPASSASRHACLIVPGCAAHQLWTHCALLGLGRHCSGSRADESEPAGHGVTGRVPRPRWAS
jgi:hypothetical protein